MFKESNSKKAQRKLAIKELAEIATEAIYKNNILDQTISIYLNQINIIKKILELKSKLSNNNNLLTTSNKIKGSNEISKDNNNKNESNIKLLIKREFLSYYQQLKESVDTVKETNRKLLQKYKINYNIIFDDSSLTKIDLNKHRTDIFILDYELKKKNDIIKKLNENLLNSRRHSIFREAKRESETNRNSGTNYLNTDNLYLQRDLQIECKHYNKCINKCNKKIKKKEMQKEEEKNLKDIINKYRDELKIMDKNRNIKNSDFFSFNVTKINNKNKINKYNNNKINSLTTDDLGQNYQFDNDYLEINSENDKNLTVMMNNEYNPLFCSSENLKLSNRMKEKKKVKQKFNFLTLDELFDINNVEGEKELIIQEELHSDDEVIFEKKIKNKKRINTEYLSQIKKQVPGLYLNQIEFNKKKVMNEADLYSFQRREFNRQNIDENIKTMKKKIKIMKKRIAINEEKLKALINFDKEVKEQYKVLKPIKVLSSLKDYNISFMKNEFYTFRTNNNKNYKNDIIPEVDEKNYATQANNPVEFGDEYDKYDPDAKYDLNEDDDDIDDYSDKMRKRNNNIKKKDIDDDNIEEDKKNKKGKKNIEYNNDENKAKSK